MARSKEDIDSVVSGAGLVADITTRLVKAVKKQGGTLQDIHRLTTDDGEATIAGMAKLIVGEREQGPSNIHRVTVDRDKKLKAMIQAGRYDWTNADITEKHFPVEGSGTVEVDIELVHYGHNMSTDAVLNDLDTRGLRPAKIEELLALGAAKPDLQREFPIIALGSVWRDFGGRCCPYLSRGGALRGLDLDWVGVGWVERCRFAAVRK